MELRLLRYFLAAAQEENITRAAQSLHISQPSLSRQLMELEREIGKPLFVRGKRKLTLTEEGMLLRRRADEMLTLLEKTERELRADAKEPTGEVSIGGTPTASVLQAAARDIRASISRFTAATPSTCSSGWSMAVSISLFLSSRSIPCSMNTFPCRMRRAGGF